MNELDRMRSQTLYGDEVLKVRYNGRAGNFPKGIDIEAHPKMKKYSHLPYPEPKWIACEYYITDTDGDKYRVARERYGELAKGFSWVTD